MKLTHTLAAISCLLVVGACASNGGAPGGGSGGSPATGAGGSTNAGSGGAAGAGTSGSGGAGMGGTSAGTGGGAAGRNGAGGAGGAAGLGGAGGSDASCPGATYNPASPPMTLTLSGSLGAHDPAVYVQGNTLYLGATGLNFKTSTTLTSWASWQGGAFSRPAWTATMVPGVSGLWAPDISNFGGAYHLYYAASTFGSNRSCIGQATRAALDSGSWTDQGMVVCSNVGTTDNWNAIDPNVVVDDAGTPWLVFGSFWGGIQIAKLDSSGNRADTTLFAVAHHAKGEEGAWVFKRCGFYYLFFSSGACCNGAFDYNIEVGRSKTVTGPYLDKTGADLASGGGTLLVQGNASWVAPGHNAVITYNGKTYNVYHALQGSSSGPATLRIAEIAWDADGWPVSGGP